MSVYRASLEALIDLHNAPITLISESERLRTQGTSVGNYIASASVNTDKMLRFWHHGELPTPWWKGELDKAYYLQRVENEVSVLEQDAVRRACMYLGCVVSRRENNIVPAGIKLSFCPYPSKLPRLGRVEWKVRDTKSNTTIAPWIMHAVNDTHISSPALRKMKYTPLAVHVVDGTVNGVVNITTL
jgi:hypothetical protein